MSDTYFYAVGKRKRSIATVRVFPGGTGKVEINEKPMKDFFSIDALETTITEPLEVLGQNNAVDITVKVTGGGTTGQAHAIRHGISKAMVLMDESFRVPLKRKGFLVRDARTVERKKPGLRKARRSPQWAKR